MDEGSIPGVTPRGHRLKGSDRFPSLTKPKGMFQAATVPCPPPPPRAPIQAVTAHSPPPPQCAFTGRDCTPELLAASLTVVVDLTRVGIS